MSAISLEPPGRRLRDGIGDRYTLAEVDAGGGTGVGLAVRHDKLWNCRALVRVANCAITADSRRLRQPPASPRISPPAHLPHPAPVRRRPTATHTRGEPQQTRRPQRMGSSTKNRSVIGYNWNECLKTFMLGRATTYLDARRARGRRTIPRSRRWPERRDSPGCPADRGTSGAGTGIGSPWGLEAQPARRGAENRHKAAR
jgi:hypothetical protein